ncbi:metal ABC transporter ATP-binding protein [Gloeocapsopsis crepidinum LEGE 06123]|uniref:Metal ABC transporter ATP-binding protein n=1 Tax=Gloeocapsopsis crepidinum LEGE 06123 TaxID=588587 RepID=A0ABR9UM99_9CHRO|nr:metal ABC transporter ATP-binding protein [Gloeocapsopsis crepidinum]MBE9189408.1 metal ABC transporter ATP-binding protein [Gloeocapsopsis crepidinum LEGE 06123]
MTSHISNSHPIVKVENLTIYQHSYCAVRDVSFALLPGTNTAIVGPNGAGKSTLVQAVLNLIPYSVGKVEIFDRPIERLGHLRNQLGYVPQNFVFDRSFPLSVSELVGLGWIREGRGALALAKRGEAQRDEVRGEGRGSFWRSWNHGQQEKKAAIAQALRRVGVYHLRNQAIGTLSGGEMKRVLLAYCLVLPRKLLVLDEAFAGVDAQGTADFYNLLHELQQEEGWTVLQVSHDIDMVSRHCDRVICLNQTLVCTGTPEVALSAQNLLATYGPSFSRYQHNHS